jgi:hypothetical protein
MKRLKTVTDAVVKGNPIHTNSMIFTLYPCFINIPMATIYVDAPIGGEVYPDARPYEKAVMHGVGRGLEFLGDDLHDRKHGDGEVVVSQGVQDQIGGVLRAPPHGRLIAAIAWDSLLMAGLVRIHALRNSFGIALTSRHDLEPILGFGAGVFITIEIEKWVLRLIRANKRGRRWNEGPITRAGL